MTVCKLCVRLTNTLRWEVHVSRVLIPNEPATEDFYLFYSCGRWWIFYFEMSKTDVVPETLLEPQFWFP